MVSLTTTTVIEGASIGFLSILILLLVCIIIIKRRRELKRLQSNNNNYTRLDSKTSAADFLQGKLAQENTPFAPTELTAIQPPHVTWAEPVTEFVRRPRSASCPFRRNAVVDLGLNTNEENTSKSVETPSKRERRRSWRTRRSKTDSCYHVCQIQFTVFYNYYHTKFIVQLVCAANIPSTFGVTYGSCIEVELLPNSEKATTSIKFHTNNPVFDETAEFTGILPDELLNKSLKLRLYTVDRFSHSNIVGEVTAPLAELDINPKKPTTIWRPITTGDQQSRISSSLLSLKDLVDRGDLTISLKYQILTNKITVVIMKALNLPNISKIFAIDPYVIVKLLLNLQTVQTKKTTIKRRTTTPCWNEPLVFEIDSKIPISEYSMSFKVKSHNSLSEDPTVGEIEIGYHADGAGRQHWKDMIVRKNQDRAMSHKIR